MRRTLALVAVCLLPVGWAGAQPLDLSKHIGVGPTLRLAEVPSHRPPVGSLIVSVSTTTIHVDGQRALSVRCVHDGRPCATPRPPGARLSIDPMNKEHAKRASLLVVPLKEAVQRFKRAFDAQTRALDPPARRRLEQTDGVGTLIVDSDIPFRVLVEVVYSIAMAEVWDLRLPVYSRAGIGTLRVQLPRRGEGAEPEDANLTVMMSTKGTLSLVWTDPVGEPKVEIPRATVDAPYCATSAPPRGFKRAGGACVGYDYPTLQKRLLATRKTLLKAGRNVGRIYVTADSDVPWAAVAQVVSTVTCRRSSSALASMEAYLKAGPLLAAKPTRILGHPAPLKLCEPLVPRVVFAVSD